MIIIEYQRWGLHFDDRKWWVAIDSENGQVLDYGTKQQLIDWCEKENLCYQVRQHHRKGGFSIVKSNC